MGINKNSEAGGARETVEVGLIEGGRNRTVGVGNGNSETDGALERSVVDLVTAGRIPAVGAGTGDGDDGDNEGTGE